MLAEAEDWEGYPDQVQGEYALQRYPSCFLAYDLDSRLGSRGGGVASGRDDDGLLGAGLSFGCGRSIYYGYIITSRTMEVVHYVKG